MTDERIYERDQNYYHADCLVEVMLDDLDVDPAHKAWVEAFETSDDAAHDLRRIARRMRVDLSDPTDMDARRFPRRVPEPPDPPSLCRACLNFFPTGVEAETDLE